MAPAGVEAAGTGEPEALAVAGPGELAAVAWLEVVTVGWPAAAAVELAELHAAVPSSADAIIAAPGKA
ncbi:MAG: hypothetical protein ACRDOI_30150 [Trebonia sp.]